MMIVTKGNCDITNCKEKAVGWIPIMSDDDNKIVGSINFCMNHKQDCIDEFHASFSINPGFRIISNEYY